MMLLAPWACSNWTMACPAAPAPLTTIFTEVMSFPTTRSALIRAASTTMAVPC